VAFISSALQEGWRLGLPSYDSVGQGRREIMECLARDLKERSRELMGRGAVRTRVVDASGAAGPRLVDLAMAEKADLIVVGASQRRGLEKLRLGSTSRDILHTAPMSVACIPMSPANTLSDTRIPQVRRVLVPTDFSTLGNRAIPYAYAILQRGGEVCLVHVVLPQSSPAADPDQIERQRASRCERLSARLRQLIPRQAEARGLRTQVQVVEHPSPAIAIAQAAERFGANLICLSSQGRTGLAKAILGSVAQAVMARSERPVLVIRPPADRPRG
jgi:nucleotide-binding universal stress UspA family protein